MASIFYALLKFQIKFAVHIPQIVTAMKKDPNKEKKQNLNFTTMMEFGPHTTKHMAMKNYPNKEKKQNLKLHHHDGIWTSQERYSTGKYENAWIVVNRRKLRKPMLTWESRMNNVSKDISVFCHST